MERFLQCVRFLADLYKKQELLPLLTTLTGEPDQETIENSKEVGICATFLSRPTMH